MQTPPRSEFGAKVIAPAPLLKTLVPLFSHKDAAVRGTAKAMTVLLARWAGAGTVQAAVVDKAPDAVRKELDKELAELPRGKPAVARYTRREVAKRQAAGPPALPDDAAAAAPGSSGGARAVAPIAVVAAAAVDDDDDDEVGTFGVHGGRVNTGGAGGKQTRATA